jgi:hypothetical protein
MWDNISLGQNAHEGNDHRQRCQSDNIFMGKNIRYSKANCPSSGCKKRLKLAYTPICRRDGSLQGFRDYACEEADINRVKR